PPIRCTSAASFLNYCIAINSLFGNTPTPQRISLQVSTGNGDYNRHRKMPSRPPISKGLTSYIGTTVTETAHLVGSPSGAPVAGAQLGFAIELGPDAGAAGRCIPTDCTTDS